MLETARLVLRPPVVEDAPVIQVIVNNPKIAGNTQSIPHPYPDGAATAFIADVNEKWGKGRDFVFVIAKKSDNTPMGVIGLHKHEFDRAEIGYLLGEDYWQLGYATEAAARIVQFGFNDLNLNRIQATYFSHNTASRRVMEKIGMTYEGILRQYTQREGKFIDVGMCAILRTDYNQTL